MLPMQFFVASAVSDPVGTHWWILHGDLEHMLLRVLPEPATFCDFLNIFLRDCDLLNQQAMAAPERHRQRTA